MFNFSFIKKHTPLKGAVMRCTVCDGLPGTSYPFVNTVYAGARFSVCTRCLGMLLFTFERQNKKIKRL